MTTFLAVTDTEKQLSIKKAHKVPINFIIFLLEKKPFPLTIRGLKFRFKLKTIMNDILQNPNSNSKKVDLSSKNQQKQTYNFNKLQKRLRRNVGNAIADFNMIEDGDRVMVCLSGGKDSYTLLDILLNLRLNAPINFEIVAVNLDQKQPGFPEHILPEYLQSIGVEYKIVEENTYGIVKEKIPEGKTTCSLCSRLRRGILYRTATELGATKIALGHHRDDMLETLFLNMFYGGKLKSMPPKLISDDGKQIVIRPLAYCKEKDIEKYSIAKQFPIIPCNLCGSQPNLQRQVVKEMLQKWDRQYPGRIETMFSAIQNITLSHLCDPKLFDFKGIKRGQVPEGVDGDIAFDKEDLPVIPSFTDEDEETTDFTAEQMISFKEVK
jgi:tRNA 2-thiocytidine biosynthesis protein ttcA